MTLLIACLLIYGFGRSAKACGNALVDEIHKARALSLRLLARDGRNRTFLIRGLDLKAPAFVFNLEPLHHWTSRIRTPLGRVVQPSAPTSPWEGWCC